MRIAVIGAGVSGIIFSINRKRLHPEDHIVIFEHLDKPLKKILATGNGKCNIANKKPIYQNYDEPIVQEILKTYNFEKQKEFLNSLNVKIKLVNDLAYPITESAVTVRNALLKAISELGIRIVTNSNVMDYAIKDGQLYLYVDETIIPFDKIVIATGGYSSPNLGSDGSFVKVIQYHGVKLEEFKPGLCPIYTRNSTKAVEGTRVKANVKLFNNDELLFNEDGEVLFKNKGLSGIVIFNMSRVIAPLPYKPYKIVLDLLPDISEKELRDFLKEKGRDVLLETHLHPNLAKWLNRDDYSDDDIIKQMKKMTFTFDELYEFDDSQISVGGIKFDQLTDSLEYKKEKGVYFLGELLNYDAPCGGYNLMWAIATGLYVANKM